MSDLIDETVAWHLVRSARPRDADEVAVRVQYDPRPDVWVQVHRSGGWEASAPVTDDARDVFDLYLPLRVEADFVIGQAGQSVDGRIATETGRSHYVTGPSDIERLHRLRALVDAVVVGAGTVQADDPRLTVRRVEGDQPVRVVLDPSGRSAADSNVFTDGAGRTVWVQSEDRIGIDPPSAQVEVMTLPIDGPRSGFAPHAVLDALRRLGLRRVLVEGGGVTVSRFLEAGALDRLHVAVAPLVIGSGRPAISLDPIDDLADALRPKCRHFRLGDDVLFDFDLRAGDPG